MSESLETHLQGEGDYELKLSVSTEDGLAISITRCRDYVNGGYPQPTVSGMASGPDERGEQGSLTEDVARNLQEEDPSLDEAVLEAAENAAGAAGVEVNTQLLEIYDEESDGVAVETVVLYEDGDPGYHRLAAEIERRIGQNPVTDMLKNLDEED
ncbi:MAG: hypothetical protein ABEJ03_02060 [Candidatus Nanohaloarchaea archaeon]